MHDVFLYEACMYDFLLCYMLQARAGAGRAQVDTFTPFGSQENQAYVLPFIGADWI
jgi:hypothetical protein